MINRDSLHEAFGIASWLFGIGANREDRVSGSSASRMRCGEPAWIQSHAQSLRIGNCESKPFSVPMPKTSMHKNDFTPPCKNHVGLTKQIPHVQAVSKSHCVGDLANSHFRLCIFRPNPAHSLTSLRFC
jgi:hypothetical protein